MVARLGPESRVETLLNVGPGSPVHMIGQGAEVERGPECAKKLRLQRPDSDMAAIGALVTAIERRIAGDEAVTAPGHRVRTPHREMHRDQREAAVDHSGIYVLAEACA
jgi:hypothetical protein